ncbi:DNA cytosine methyltransferase [Flavobacterium collinsii]|uniref:DNA cytosine methyltransferase n=1 Tax=Flavobacterium collinsii TaxID=1114861 RepID=UPI003756C404
MIHKIISLFSGGGFLDLGFINQGFQIEEALEIEPYFIHAYNHGMTTYFNKSENHYIKNNLLEHRNIQRPIDVSNTFEQKRLKDNYTDITGIIGGPPCQDYSVGGKNGGIEGERGRLIYSYFKIVQDLKPGFMFFENVEGLYKTKRHRKSFDEFVEDIKKEGYYVYHTLLNVLEYGYAQDRSRIALVAFKKEIIDTLIINGYEYNTDNQYLKFSSDDNLVFKWPKPLFENPKALDWPKRWNFGNNKSIIQDKNVKKLTVKNAFQGLNSKTPNQDEYFQPKSTKFKTVEEGNTDRKSFKRLHRYRYSPTVAYGNNEVHLHPTKERRLTVREGLRLQTVPDEYVLPKSMPLTPKFKLISNGVPTAKAELIAKEIRNTLSNYYECLNKIN